MNKAQAKREAAGMIASFVSADLEAVIEASGAQLDQADYDRVADAMAELTSELSARSLGTFYAPKERRADIRRRAVAGMGIASPPPDRL